MISYMKNRPDIMIIMERKKQGSGYPFHTIYANILQP